EGGLPLLWSQKSIRHHAVEDSLIRGGTHASSWMFGRTNTGIRTACLFAREPHSIIQDFPCRASTERLSSCRNGRKVCALTSHTLPVPRTRAQSLLHAP